MNRSNVDDVESNATAADNSVVLECPLPQLSEPEPESLQDNGIERSINDDLRQDEEAQQQQQQSQPPSSFATTTTTAATLTIPPSPLPQNEIKITQTKAPKDALKAVYNAGKYKAGLTLDVLMVQSFMAGIYIAMAGNLYLAVGGGILGASLFPTGLMAVLLTSGELFTGDALIFIASLLGGRVSIKSLLRNWTVSWFCNFAGCLVWATFMSYLSNQLEDAGQTDLAVQVATKKAYQAWYAIFLKGIGANFMVCLGVWQYTCAEEVAGKVLALWFPIAGFVMMGFDHSIANQYFIPTGMMLGANISITRLLFQALLPATLGNLVGGGIFIGGIYWYVFDSMETSTVMRERIMHSGWVRAAINSSRKSLHLPSSMMKSTKIKRPPRNSSFPPEQPPSSPPQSEELYDV